MEDNAKTIINVAGDYVQSKHVDYEINNVEAGGIGIQFVNGKQTSTNASSSPNGRTIPKKKSSHFLETRTFIYRYNNARPEDNRRLPLLFQFLTKEHHHTKSYLEPETKPDEFYALFNGELSDIVITWTGSKQDLYYFIKRLKERNLIEIPQSLTIWTITQNHISDRRGNYFEDMRNQHNPKTSQPTIERLIDILDPAVTDTAELDELCRKIGGSFGGK